MSLTVGVEEEEQIFFASSSSFNTPRSSCFVDSVLAIFDIKNRKRILLGLIALVFVFLSYLLTLREEEGQSSVVLLAEQAVLRGELKDGSIVLLR